MSILNEEIPAYPHGALFVLALNRWLVGPTLPGREASGAPQVSTSFIGCVKEGMFGGLDGRDTGRRGGSRLRGFYVEITGNVA